MRISGDLFHSVCERLSVIQLLAGGEDFVVKITQNVLRKFLGSQESTPPPFLQNWNFSWRTPTGIGVWILIAVSPQIPSRFVYFVYFSVCLEFDSWAKRNVVSRIRALLLLPIPSFVPSRLNFCQLSS